MQVTKSDQLAQLVGETVVVRRGDEEFKGRLMWGDNRENLVYTPRVFRVESKSQCFTLDSHLVDKITESESIEISLKEIEYEDYTCAVNRELMENLGQMVIAFHRYGFAHAILERNTGNKGFRIDCCEFSVYDVVDMRRTSTKDIKLKLTLK